MRTNPADPVAASSLPHSIHSHIRIIETELGLVRARHLGHTLPKRLDNQPRLDFADIVVSVPLLGKAAKRILDICNPRPLPLRQQCDALVHVVDVELGVEALAAKEKPC